MVTLVARRLAVGVVIVWLASVLVFLATQLLPGDAARELLGRQSTPQALAQLRKQLHLTEPALTQYWHWLSDMATLHWGNSLTSESSVSSIISRGIENTGLVMLLVTLIATPLAIVFGSISALRSEGIIDHVISVIVLVLVALPAFVIAVTLIFLLATTVFHWLPAASIADPSRSIFSQLNILVLPVATLTLAVVSYPLRMVRASMIEVMQSDYVLLAQLHGLSRRRVVFRHALPNAIATTIQATALNLVFLAGGVVVVESVFSYPGLGYALVQAVDERDIPVIQTAVVLLAAFYVVVNIVADIGVILVTPRLRVGARDGSRRAKVVPTAEVLAMTEPLP
ncbi:MAG TPA: ABC transporter permease [Gaiellaceae bacterium]|jgi:peptide/nickel transport system permease protein|nr:ABC transporter permease [Gaiellaceae bacterium]